MCVCFFGKYWRAHDKSTFFYYLNTTFHAGMNVFNAGWKGFASGWPLVGKGFLLHSSIAQEKIPVQKFSCCSLSSYTTTRFIYRISTSLKTTDFTTQSLQPLTINMTNLSPCFCLRRRVADRSRRLRSPGMIHHSSKNGQSSSSSSSASKDGSSSSRPESAGNNSRFSFLKGKGFKGIFQ